jgi:hypothetical protein
MAGIIENGVVTVRFVTPMSVISNQPVFVADTLSLKRQVLSQGVQRWEIITNVEPSNTSADFLLHSVTNGFDKVFDIQMPQVYRRAGNTNTVSLLRTNEEMLPNSNNIIVNSNGVLNKGEFIKFSNHDKVYLVLNTITAGNDITLNIFPNLIKPVPINTIILTGKDVILKARYDTATTIGISYIDGILSDPGTVGFTEALT